MEETQIGWILIPPQVMADKKLTQSAKVLYGKINGLTSVKGYCWASNDTLAEYLGMKDIRNPLEKLIKFGYIKRVVFPKEGNARHLYPLLPQQQTSVATATDPSVATATDTTMHYDYAKKEENFFSQNPNRVREHKQIQTLLEEGSMSLGGQYSPDGRSPRIRLAEKRALEKSLGLRPTPELVRFIYKAGWDFRKRFKEAKGFEYEGDVILDTIAKTLKEWHKRGRTTEDIQRLLDAFFKSKKARENTVTPTACFSEHTYQSFAQGTLK